MTRELSRGNADGNAGVELAGSLDVSLPPSCLEITMKGEAAGGRGDGRRERRKGGIRTKKPS